MPERIQLSRQKGWRMPPNTLKVDRSTRWGNPIRIDRERIDGRWMFRVHGSATDRNGGPAYADPATARYFATRQFEADLLNGLFGDAYPSLPEIREHLGGHNLGCWCTTRRHRNGLYERGYCHADILLDIADGAWSGYRLSG